MKIGIANFIFVPVLLLVGTEVLAQTTLPSRKIELQCGEHKVAITCGEVVYPGDPQDKRQCNHNTLSFTDKSGKVYVPKQPKNFRQEFVVEKTPVSMACTQGKDGHYYVTVEFSACPLGANYASCVTVDLFKSEGKRLTVNSRHLDSTQAKLGIPYTKRVEIEGDTK